MKTLKIIISILILLFSKTVNAPKDPSTYIVQTGDLRALTTNWSIISPRDRTVIYIMYHAAPQKTKHIWLPGLHEKYNRVISINFYI